MTTGKRGGLRTRGHTNVRQRGETDMRRHASGGSARAAPRCGRLAALHLAVGQSDMRTPSTLIRSPDDGTNARTDLVATRSTNDTETTERPSRCGRQMTAEGLDGRLSS